MLVNHKHWIGRFNYYHVSKDSNVLCIMYCECIGNGNLMGLNFYEKRLYAAVDMELMMKNKSLMLSHLKFTFI